MNTDHTCGYQLPRHFTTGIFEPRLRPELTAWLEKQARGQWWLSFRHIAFRDSVTGEERWKCHAFLHTEVASDLTHFALRWGHLRPEDFES